MTKSPRYFTSIEEFIPMRKRPAAAAWAAFIIIAVVASSLFASPAQYTLEEIAHSDLV